MMGLRKRFQQDTRLYRKSARLFHRLLSRWIPDQIRCHRNKRNQKEYALPGIIMAVLVLPHPSGGRRIGMQTFGSGLRTHPHFHLLVTDGAFFPNDGGFYQMGLWDTAALTEKIRASLVQSFVARGILREETAKILLEMPIERSGFSVFVGESLTLPDNEADIRRILQYIFRSSLPLKHLHYEESTGQVQYRDPRGPWKTWEHAIHFLSDFVQHIPRARQHQVTYAGWFANALGNLKDPLEEPKPEQQTRSKASRYTRWAAMVLRTWSIDPELCWQCGQKMVRSRTLFDPEELRRLLKNLKLGDYPIRPRSPPPPDNENKVEGSEGGQTVLWSDEHSQAPPGGWENWDAA